MLSLLIIALVFAAMTVIIALSVVGGIILRKKSANPNPQIDPDNVIDVTSKEIL